MNTGAMTERVALQSPTRTADGVGGFAVTWNTTSTIWASVEPLRGKEQLEAMQLEGSNFFKVTLRNDITISLDDRFVWSGINLNIREAPITPRTSLFRTLIVEAGVAV